MIRPVRWALAAALALGACTPAPVPSPDARYMLGEP